MITIAVDDNLSAAQQIRDIMERIDPEGAHFAGIVPKEVLSLAEAAKPDIVWMETEMSAESGLILAEKVRRVSPDTNIVFVTEHGEHAAEAFALHASGYLLKPVSEAQLVEEVAQLRRPARGNPDAVLKVQCFGNFEAFGKGGIIKFSRSRGKEALAYLIDRRGAGCTVAEICSVLWEDRQADKALKSQCRVVMSALRKDLEAAGAGDVIVKGWNQWSVDVSKIKCDYYDYLKNDPGAVRQFRGEYMSQYSWAEMTTGELMSSD